jgi:LL-diaminopimelate aminotransferase
MAGGKLHIIPVNEDNGFLPDFDSVPKDILKKTKMIFLSYPNNPTTAVAPKSFFEKAVSFARENGIILIHDLAYSEIVFDGYKAPSMLEIPGAKEVTVEFHSLSKTYNMAGWRVGFAVGNAKVLKILAKTKGYIDFGMFKPVQYAAIAALAGPQEWVREQVKVYQDRRDAMVDALEKIGWNVPKPKATFYLWARIPEKYRHLTSMEFVSLLIKETGVVVSPGTGFGGNGEGFVRFALVKETPRLLEAAVRIKKVLD